MKNQETLNKSLLLAVQMGNLKAVQKALNEGADIDFQGENGQTALMRAILNQKEDVFNLLLFENANVNLQDKEGKTALMMAYQMGLTDFIEELKLKGADEKIKDIYGNTAQDYELEESVGMPKPVSIEKKKAQKLLMESILIESKEGIDIALKNGADLEYQNFEGEEGTPLLFALKKGNVQIISYLMERGAKANEEMVKIAAKDGNVYALDELTKRGKQFFSPEVKKLLFRNHLSPAMQRIIQEYEESQGTLEGKTEEEIQVAVTQAQEQKQKEEVAKIEAKKEEMKKEQAEKEELQKQEQKKEEQKAQEEKEQKEAQEEQKGENEMLDEEKQEVITNQVKETLQRQEKRAKSTEHLFKLIAHDVQFHDIEDFVRGENDAVEKEDPRAVLTSSVATDIMRFAKERAAEFKKDPQELMNNAAASLLYLAAKYNQVDVAKHVLTLRPNFFKEKKDRWGAVHSAASFGNIEVMNEFINFGAELNVDENAWSSPLKAAIFQGQEAMIKFLFSKGANMRPGKNSELIDAAESEKTMAGFDALLLRAGKDKEAFRKALFNAAYNGNKEAVQKILKTVDKWGAVAYNQVFKPLKTYKEIFATYALMGAVAGQQKEMASFLIENGADVKADSFVYAAVHKHDAEMLKLLIEKGAIATMPERLLSGGKIQHCLKPFIGSLVMAQNLLKS
ncbi:MAG: ankyrin repeat domain-containing protein [Alphaproteobacteria bacterium]|nr:ankyrin repeat domain-containing protein [Alphaproteobacteria bacterium]